MPPLKKECRNNHCNPEQQKTDAQEEDLEAAIYEAIDNCIENYVMEEFFRENRNEVAKNMVLDYTWERREELIRAEEYEDGRQEGMALLKAVVDRIRSGESEMQLREEGIREDVIAYAIAIINN